MYFCVHQRKTEREKKPSSNELKIKPVWSYLPNKLWTWYFSLSRSLTICMGFRFPQGASKTPNKWKKTVGFLSKSRLDASHNWGWEKFKRSELGKQPEQLLVHGSFPILHLVAGQQYLIQKHEDHSVNLQHPVKSKPCHQASKKPSASGSRNGRTLGLAG